MIILNIDVTKIPKEAIQSKPEWKGKFLKLKLVDHPKDDNDGFIAIDQTKEQRESGEKSAIVGNWRHVGAKSPPPARDDARGGTSAPSGGYPRAPRPQQAPAARKPVDPDLDDMADSDVPF